MNRSWSSLRSTVSRFRACWRPLALCDIAGKTAAFVLLTPLVAVLFRVLLALSGRECWPIRTFSSSCSDRQAW